MNAPAWTGFVEALDRARQLTSADARGEPLCGHDGAVFDVVSSVVAGKLVIVSAGEDGTVRRWDAVTGTQIGACLSGHPGWATAVAVTETGGRPVVIVGARDGTLRRWDLVTGEPIGIPWQTGLGRVYAVSSFAMEGQIVVLASGERGFSGPWDVASIERVGMLDQVCESGGPLTVTSVGGRPVAVMGGLSGSKGTVRAWDIATGALIFDAMPGHYGPVWAVTTAQIGSQAVVVSSGYDATIRVWDLDTGNSIGPRPLSFNILGNYCLTVVTLSGRPIVLAGGGDEDGNVRLCDLATGCLVAPPVGGHTDRVTTITSVILDGDPVGVSGGIDGTVRLWNLGASDRQEAQRLLSDAVFAATDMLDRAERGGNSPPIGGGPLMQLRGLAQTVGEPLTAYTRVLCARSSWLRGEVRTARRLAEIAVGEVRVATTHRAVGASISAGACQVRQIERCWKLRG